MKTDFNLLTLFSNPNNISIAKSYDRYDNVLSIDLEQVENGYHVDAVVRVRRKTGGNQPLFFSPPPSDFPIYYCKVFIFGVLLDCYLYFG